MAQDSAGAQESSSSRLDLQSRHPQPEIMELEGDDVPIESPEDRRSYWMAVGGVLTMVLCTWYLVLVNDPVAKGVFAFHPPLQILSIGLFCLGILTLQPTNLARPKTKARASSRHQLIMFALGLPSIIFGTSAIWFAHRSGSGHSHHSKSWHGALGIAALVWMGVQIILGGGSVWFGGRLFGSDPKRIYKYHRASGYLLIVLFLFVVHLGGAWSNFALKNSNTLFRFLAYLVAPILIITGIASRIRFNKMPIF